MDEKPSTTETTRPILIQAWIQSRMEKDRALLTLSAGGIGLISGVVTSLDHITIAALLLFSLGLSCFLIVIFCLLLIFKRNSDYILRLLRGSNEKQDKILSALDRVVQTSFIAGVLATSAAAIVHQIG